MEQRPKKRICPSDMLSSFVNMSRHAVGEAKGSIPSNTNISASAIQMVSDTGLRPARITCLSH